MTEIKLTGQISCELTGFVPFYSSFLHWVPSLGQSSWYAFCTPISKTTKSGPLSTLLSVDGTSLCPVDRHTCCLLSHNPYFWFTPSSVNLILSTPRVSPHLFCFTAILQFETEIISNPNFWKTTNRLSCINSGVPFSTLHPHVCPSFGPFLSFFFLVSLLIIEL